MRSIVAITLGTFSMVVQRKSGQKLASTLTVSITLPQSITTLMLNPRPKVPTGTM